MGNGACTQRYMLLLSESGVPTLPAIAELAMLLLADEAAYEQMEQLLRYRALTDLAALGGCDWILV